MAASGLAQDEESNCCPSGFQVFVPTRDACFHVYESVMYLRPSTDNLGWGVVAYQSPSWHVESIQPQFHPAFNLDFCYTLPCSGLDAQLNWTHFRSNDSRSKKVTPGRQWISPFSQTGFDDGLGELTKAHAKVWHEFDAINLDAGVAISAGPYMEMHFFTGLGAIRIKEKLASHFERRGENSSTIKLRSTSMYQGIGPRIGMDCAYKLCYGMKFVGGFATSLYFGSQTAAKYKFNKDEIGSHCVTHTVPAVEANLGVNYSSCYCGYDFTIETGYMGAVYINALKGYEAGTAIFPLERGSLSTGSVKRVQSNFSLDGPYARLNVRF